VKKILITVLLLSSVSLFAADSSSGCGPGWYIAKENSLLSSALRATTNGILLPIVTLGMTFGTSNCSKHSIVKNEMEDLKFTTENYFEMLADAAKGEGNFLTAYGELMGCHGEMNTKFKKSMKKNFGNIFGQENTIPSSVVEKTYKMIIEDKELFNSCFVS
jgi:hypothetical protein